MTKKLDLAEAPAIEVTKKGKRFTVGEVSAYNLTRIGELLGSMSSEGVGEAYDVLFGDKAKEARGIFTVTDLRAICGAVAGREKDPLEENSEKTETETP
jgi:hypothetical protein